MLSEKAITQRLTSPSTRTAKSAAPSSLYFLLPVMGGVMCKNKHDTGGVFYLPWRKALTVLFAALFIPIVYLSIAHDVYGHTFLALFNLFVAMAGIWYFSAVSVSNDGLVLYRVNRLKWEDVKNTRRVNFLGLSYVLITRHKGFTWWLPLYYDGKRNIQDALRSVVPNGNPLRESIDGV